MQSWSGLKQGMYNCISTQKCSTMQFGVKEQLDGNKSSRTNLETLVETPRQHEASAGRVRMDYIWGASIVKTCLRRMIDLWEMRKEEVTKQQKRKEKAAISVRDLHKLQEIARPSDSMLFYQEVEKEIEQGTAETLDGFVAMKTRPIYNSVKKWVDRTISGAKSVIGWFRTGGKENREIIERAENRQRDQFKNEQYKKPQKKQRVGTVQYTPL